ncbi:hypothetical protein Pen01_78290 [Phytomonospora endophytica]|nr:hypothetical protein Pen01_78290 [Phytomonospora endophytica]
MEDPNYRVARTGLRWTIGGVILSALIGVGAWQLPKNPQSESTINPPLMYASPDSESSSEEPQAIWREEYTTTHPLELQECSTTQTDPYYTTLGYGKIDFDSEEPSEGFEYELQYDEEGEVSDSVTWDARWSPCMEGTLLFTTMDGRIAVRALQEDAETPEDCTERLKEAHPEGGVSLQPVLEKEPSIICMITDNYADSENERLVRIHFESYISSTGEHLDMTVTSWVRTRK